MKFALTTAAIFALSITFMALSASSGGAASKKAQTKAPAICTMDYTPVCGTVKKKRTTFGNMCQARHAGATRIRKGECK